MDADEYVLDAPVVRAFIAGVRAGIAAGASPADAIERIRPGFADLLADPEWLTAAYQEVAPRTTSPQTSVSIHLLTNDTGCVWRHAYDPDSGQQRPFRSGYVNVDCE